MGDMDSAESILPRLDGEQTIDTPPQALPLAENVRHFRTRGVSRRNGLGCTRVSHRGDCACCECKVARIGLLDYTPSWEPFLQGLRELGYREDKNLDNRGGNK